MDERVIPTSLEGVQPVAGQADLDYVRGNCAAFSVRKASRVVSRFYAAHLAKVGLEPTQFTILVACARQDKATVTKLASRLEIERSALARNLAVMERQDLVSVEAGKDRRTRLVRITEHGRALLVKAYPHWLTGHQQLVAAFDKARLTTLLGELDALVAATHRS